MFIIKELFIYGIRSLGLGTHAFSFKKRIWFVSSL